MLGIFTAKYAAQPVLGFYESVDKRGKKQYLQSKKACFPRISTPKCKGNLIKELVATWWMCSGFPEEFQMQDSAAAIKSNVSPTHSRKKSRSSAR